MSDHALRDLQADVTFRHRLDRKHVGYAPSVPPGQHVQWHGKDVLTEANELVLAIGNEDVDSVAQGLTRTLESLVSTAVSFGIDLSPLWHAYHAHLTGSGPQPDFVDLIVKQLAEKQQRV